jgi:DNA primase
MSPYKDPDEFIKALGAEEYEKRIQDAENSFMYQIRMLQNNYDMTDPEKKSDFQKEAAKMIVLEFPTQLERENYTEAVAARFNIPKDALENTLLSWDNPESPRKRKVRDLKVAPRLIKQRTME